MGVRSADQVSTYQRLGEEPRSTQEIERGGIAVRIASGWRWGDLRRTIKEERPREERARGWAMPYAQWGGICMDTSDEMKWGDVAISEHFVGEVDRRMGKYRSGSGGIVQTRRAILQHRSCRREGSREMKTAKEVSRPILSGEVWDCLEGESAWGYKNSPNNIIWIREI